MLQKSWIPNRYIREMANFARLSRRFLIQWKLFVDQGNYYNPDFIETENTNENLRANAQKYFTDDALIGCRKKQNDTPHFF